MAYDSSCSVAAGDQDFATHLVAGHRRCLVAVPRTTVVDEGQVVQDAETVVALPAHQDVVILPTIKEVIASVPCDSPIRGRTVDQIVAVPAPKPGLAKARVEDGVISSFAIEVDVVAGVLQRFEKVPAKVGV